MSDSIGERAYSSTTDQKGWTRAPSICHWGRPNTFFLREMQFPWKKTADLLGVSESTLTRRTLEYGMTDLEESTWTQITDSDLNRIVQEIWGLNTQRWQVRNCLPLPWSCWYCFTVAFSNLQKKIQCSNSKLACVASVSVGLGSKETARNRILHGNACYAG